LKISKTSLADIMVVEPVTFKDDRGYFMETYNAEHYAEAGITVPFVQDNLSYSACGVLRGLHLQNPNIQGKLVYVLQGEVFDVAVDLRVGSPQFGCWTGVTLSSENRQQLYIPEGFAHGFCVMSEWALLAYKCTDFYSTASELTILWNDPEIGINWPIETPSLSDKDAAAIRLDKIDPAALPSYKTVSR
jgi:dTDP-4-dehydrorhamnose 3,5-epimerase